VGAALAKKIDDHVIDLLADRIVEKMTDRVVNSLADRIVGIAAEKAFLNVMNWLSDSAQQAIRASETPS